jgi:hypothetical protein
MCPWLTRCAIVDFAQLVFDGRGQRERHEQFDVDHHALLAALFELVHADVDVHLVIAQKEPAAISEPGMKQSGRHVRSSTKRVRANAHAVAIGRAVQRAGGRNV